MGILFSISSNNWLGCWMGVEINLISFIPIIIDRMRVYSSESMIKYFIIQRIGSSLLFLSIIIGDIFIVFIEYFIIIRLIIKVGCPPFHIWFPSVMEGLSWLNCFILRTIQKFTPIVILSYLKRELIIIFILIACLWGSIGGLSYSSIRKIVAYSSIYNLGWLLRGINIIIYSWCFYFLIYSLTLFMVCFLFNLYNLNYLNQLFSVYNRFYDWLIIIILLISIGGLPPFLGFVPKIIMVYYLSCIEAYIICTVLLFRALLILFFYLRMVFTGLIINSLSFKIIYHEYTFVSYLFGIISLFGLILIFLLKLYL